MKLCVDEIKKRTGVSLPRKADWIVDLRSMNEVDCIEAMPDKMLESLIRNVPLKGNPDLDPYRDAKIQIYSIDPKGLYIGQSFVQEEKILGLLTSFPRIFEGFCSSGMSKLYPLIIYGNSDGEKSAAFYVPPILESFNRSHVILDGIHRSFLSMGAGSTMTYVVITKKAESLEEEIESLPFKPKRWDSISMVKIKPEGLQKRYFELKEGHFRRLDYVGIDG